MEVSIVVYRAAIGMLNNKKCRLNIKSSVLQIWTRHGWGLCILLLIFLSILLIMAGDIELNPGPKMSCLTIGHINARSLANEEKFEEISSFILDKSFDLFAVSETWLDNKSSDESLHIPGYYSIIRKDRSGMSGGGVASYSTITCIQKMQ